MKPGKNNSAGRLTLLIAFLMAIVVPARSQRLSIELEGGIQGTNYHLPVGSTRMLPGASVGLLYAFPLQDQWDLLAGITAGLYRTQVRLPDGSAFTNYQVDDQGSAFQYNMKTEGYQETQQFVAAAVPVLLQYHTAIGSLNWYANAGAKIFFPGGDHSSITAKQLSLTGYYPDYNVTLGDLPHHGFGTLNGWKSSSSVTLKPAAALSASTGIGFPLGGGMQLSVGAFVDYGLTSLKGRNDSMPLFTYSPTGLSGAKGNGVLNTPGAGSMNLLSFGLQVRLSFGPTHPRPSRSHSTQPTAGQTEPPAAQPQASRPQSEPTPVKPPQTPVQPPQTTVQAPPASVQSSTNPASPETTAGMSDNDLKVLQSPVLFGTLGEVSLSDLAIAHLNDVAGIMQRNPSLRITITGHICNSGTATESMKIGEARAKAVAEYLRRKGIDRKRMDVGYEKESDPVVPNNPAKNYLKRRVVISAK